MRKAGVLHDAVCRPFSVLSRQSLTEHKSSSFRSVVSEHPYV